MKTVAKEINIIVTYFIYRNLHKVEMMDGEKYDESVMHLWQNINFLFLNLHY